MNLSGVLFECTICHVKSNEDSRLFVTAEKRWPHSVFSIHRCIWGPNVVPSQHAMPQLTGKACMKAFSTTKNTQKPKQHWQKKEETSHGTHWSWAKLCPPSHLPHRSLTTEVQLLGKQTGLVLTGQQARSVHTARWSPPSRPLTAGKTKQTLLPVNQMLACPAVDRALEVRGCSQCIQCPCCPVKAVGPVYSRKDPAEQGGKEDSQD